jgi:hypothetical protein
LYVPGFGRPHFSQATRCACRVCMSVKASCTHAHTHTHSHTLYVLCSCSWHPQDQLPLLRCVLSWVSKRVCACLSQMLEPPCHLQDSTLKWCARNLNLLKFLNTCLSRYLYK